MYYSIANKSNEIYEIYSISMGGNEEEKFLANATSTIEGITYDFNTNTLYYLLPALSEIYAYKDGEAKIVLSGSKTHQISAFTIYADHIYYADNHDNKIVKCSKFKCDEIESVRNNTAGVQAIKMYFPAAQNGTNACAKNNGGCQHLCLPTGPAKHVCKCAIGFSQSLTNSSACKAVEEFIIYSVGYELKGLPIDGNMHSTEEVIGPLQRISLATNIDYHMKTDYIYLADSDKGTITRIRRDGTGEFI